MSTEQVEAAFDRVGNKAGKMATEVAKSANDAGKAVDSIGDGAEKGAERFTRAEARMRDAIKKSTQELQTLGKTASEKLEFNIDAKGLDASKFAPYIAELKKAEEAQRIASGSLDSMGMSAKATAAALRGVPAQFTDIIVSLQGGQAPMTVLLQQGGQLKDMFGGVGNATKALGGYVLGLVNPFTLAAAAVAVLAVAYNSGSKEADAYRSAIILSGNAAGTSVSQLSAYALAISGVVGTQGAAAESLAAMASGGKVTSDVLKEAAQAAVLYERATGQAVDKTAEKFSSLANDPLKAVLKLNDGTNFLTISVYKQIKSLEEQGKAAEATAVAQRAYADSLSSRSTEILNNLGSIERAWLAIKDGAKAGWDAMLGIGREKTTSDKLASVRKEIAAVEGRIASGASTAGTGGFAGVQLQSGEAKRALEIDNARLQSLHAQAAALEGVAYQERQNAEQKAESAKQTQMLTQWDKEGDQFRTKAAKRDDEINKAKVEGQALIAAGLLTEAGLRQRLADINEKYKDKGGASAIKAANKELADQTKLVGQLAGLSSTFYEDWDNLAKAYKRTGGSAEDLAKAQAKLLADQPFMKAQTKDVDEADKAYRKYTDGLFKSAAALDEQTAQQNAANETFGKSKTAIAAMAAEQAKLAALNAKNVGPWTQDGVDGLNAMAKAAEDYAESLMKGVYQQSLLKYDDGIKAAQEQLELQQYGMSLLGMEEQKRSKLIAVKQSELKLQKEIRDIEKETYSLDPVENENRKNKLIADARIKAEIELQGQLLQIQDQFVQQQAQKFDDIFRQGFADMANNGMDGLKAFGKSLKTTVLTSIADGIYQALIKKWVVNITTNLMGGIEGIVGAVGSLFGGGGGGSGGSGIMGIASNAQSLYGLYTGSTMSTIGTMATNLGTMMGSNWLTGMGMSMSGYTMPATMMGPGAGVGIHATGTAASGGSAAGLGAFSGAGIGAAIVMAAAYLGGMFKSEKQVGAGLTGELGGDLYGYQLMREGGSLFSGPSYKYIIAEKELEKARAEIEELKKNPELETDGNLAYRMKYLRERVEMLEGKYGSSIAASQGPIDILQQSYSAIRETVALQAESLGLDGDAVRKMKTTLGLDEIHPDTGGLGIELSGLTEEEATAKVKAALEKANEDLARSVLGSMQEVTREVTRTYAEIIPVHDEDGNVYENRIWHDVTETVTSMEWVMSEYVREGETAVAALNRISGSLVGVNQVFDMLGADLLAASIASGDWASKLIEAMGGIDNLNTAAVSYYDRYYSDDEKRARQISTANSGMESLGFDLRVEDDNAMQKYRELVDKAISAKDEVLLAALLKFAEQFGLGVDAVVSATQAHLDELAAAKAAADEIAANAKKALEDAQNKAMRNLEQATAREVDRLNDQKATLTEQRSLANESLSLITGVFDLVRDSARELYGSVESVAAMQASQGRAFIDMALSAALSTGYLPEQDQLSQAISAVRSGIDEGAYKSQVEKDYDTLLLAGKLSALQSISGEQKTTAELQLEALDNQITSIDKQTKYLQDQLSNIKELVAISKGEYDATISVEQAVRDIYRLYDLKTSTPTTGTTTKPGTTGPTVGNGAVAGDPVKSGPTGSGGWYREVVTGAGTTYVVDNSDELTSLDKWIDKWRGTGDVAGMLNDGKAQGYSMNDIAAVMGWGYQDLIDAGKRLGIPKFDVGTNYVPRDMLAMVHEGEAIIPKADNRALMAALQNGGGGSNADVVSELRALREENKIQAGEIARLNLRVAKVVERWEGGGMPPQREEQPA
ncbi:hypothetical protein G7048_19380 [Diaphorobacter sp. HDW4B]|uniref:phage tail length tape measure family protein n=1 Tax=Diaphorobacter sp. HDW4B TaxID=2714925 RepID=UPI00140CDD7E|nr:phage tail length tape measure family protein [Diaphorobacter sp. HDW4B]QIL72326.1 hypothetical protein G7048_19380 [Diaphorobacter sp. HDW4B]